MLNLVGDSGTTVAWVTSWKVSSISSSTERSAWARGTEGEMGTVVFWLLASIVTLLTSAPRAAVASSDVLQ